ncbi:TRAM domain-containing protein [Patescibacteria group bacterium]|nr:MAG: TRAM domain-containing protein [Patescibacteria group bacterium]
MIFKRNSDKSDEPSSIPSAQSGAALVDTSVIIDARIADIAKAGFAPGKLLIPRFVLAELQNIADSSDAMRRGRGRRGLETLNTMRDNGVDMEVIEDDVSDIPEVDAKLVRLGRTHGVSVLTTDYNLNRVASIEGVRVLNINELANAVRPVILPGEHMQIKVVQPGKERGQGVGYLADGTMVVVDSGDKLIGQEVDVEITRVFQTVAGKMLFSVPQGVKPQGDGKASRKLTKAEIPQQPSNGRSNGDRPKRGPKPDNGKNGRPQGPKAQTDSRPQPNKDRAERRPRKRVSPTQRLEDSLLEMTKAE